MLLTLTAEQELLQQTTAKFLDDQVPAAEIRRLGGDPAGFTARYWRAGTGLGWTSLLAGEYLGGRSTSSQGLYDLTLVAYEFGRHAAPGPLIDTNVVASVLTVAGGRTHRQVLSGLLSGASTAAWCIGEPPPHDYFGEVAATIELEGDSVVIDGVKRPVESAWHAAHLLVTGRTGSGLTQVLVPRGTSGVSVTPLSSVDLTRRFYEVGFSGVRVPASAVVGRIGDAGHQVARQLQLAAVVLAADAVGAMQAAFDLTVDRALSRHSFERRLTSFQALKHRLADMKSWLEASHAITDAAAAAVVCDAPDAAEVVSAAKAFVGDYGAELTQECVQLHGDIGISDEHDLHLFLRRVVLNRTLSGTPADHRQRLAIIAGHREGAA